MKARTQAVAAIAAGVMVVLAAGCSSTQAEPTAEHVSSWSPAPAPSIFDPEGEHAEWSYERTTDTLRMAWNTYTQPRRDFACADNFSVYGEPALDPLYYDQAVADFEAQVC